MFNFIAGSLCLVVALISHEQKDHKWAIGLSFLAIVNLGLALT